MKCFHTQSLALCATSVLQMDIILAAVSIQSWMNSVLCLSCHLSLHEKDPMLLYLLKMDPVTWWWIICLLGVVTVRLSVHRVIYYIKSHHTVNCTNHKPPAEHRSLIASFTHRNISAAVNKIPLRSSDIMHDALYLCSGDMRSSWRGKQVLKSKSIVKQHWGAVNSA